MPRSPVPLRGIYSFLVYSFLNISPSIADSKQKYSTTYDIVTIINVVAIIKLLLALTIIGSIIVTECPARLYEFRLSK